MPGVAHRRVGESQSIQSRNDLVFGRRLDVNGIIGGYTGPGRKTVLPANGHAKISMRLVPDQDPEEIAQRLFETYVKADRAAKCPC